MRFRLTLILGIALTSSAALAAWTDFAPRPFENGAYFELYGSKERDDSHDNRRQSGWNDLFFTEKLTFFSNGYVYHPRFMQYLFSVSGALKQENYEQSFTPNIGWTSGTGFDYHFRLFFLAEHPYNFELFALRREPLYKQQSQTQHSTVETTYGGRFQYRSKPWFVHAGYLDNATTSQTDYSDVQRVNLDGEYFKEFGGGNTLTATAFYTPSRFTGSLGLSGDASQYGVTGLVDVRSARLNVTASKSTYDQASLLSGQLSNDQFAFQERLSVYLPANFRADFYYRILNNQSSIVEVGVPGPRDLTDDSKDLEAIISHKLYQSLDSRYVFLRSSRESSGGDSTSVSNSIGVDYAKLISRGRVMAGVNLATILTDSSGQADIPSEPHPAINVQPPGVFTLDQLNADPASLAIFVRSPIPPFQLLRLADSDFTVTIVANRIEIDVYLLPAGLVIPGTYDFVASYSLTTGTFEQRMNTFGFNTSVQFLDDMLTPYYSFLAVRSNVLSGVFPGVPLDSTTNTLGLTFLDGPWRAMGEFRSLAWDVNPYHQWRAEVQYSGSIDPTLRLYATADYLYRYYPEGASLQDPTAYAEKDLTLSGNVQKDFLSRTLMFSAGVSFSKVLGLVDSNAYALNSALNYKIGKLELSAGIDAYGSDTQGTTGGPYNRTHQYYFIKVLRRIF